MLSFDEGGKNSALGKLVAKRTDFAHAQIRQKILNFEDIVQKLRLSQAKRAVFFTIFVLLHFLDR